MRLTTQKYHFNRLKHSNTDKLHLDLTLTLCPPWGYSEEQSQSLPPGDPR